jgi:acetyltransferase
LRWYRLHNPADIWPPAMISGDYIGYMKRCVGGFLRDERVDGLLAILVAMDSPLHADHDLPAAARAISGENVDRKPVAMWLYGSGARRQGAAINAERLPGVACFDDLEGAMAGLSAGWRHRMLSRRRAVRPPARSEPRAALPDGERIVGRAAESFLAAYGLRIAAGGFAGDAGSAVKIAEEIGYPVVLKVVSPDWQHKTDKGGVLLDLHDRKAVENAFARLRELIESGSDGGGSEVIQVQKQLKGIELLYGIKRDRQFGAMIVAGMGGIYTETIRDVVLEPAPISPDDAERMLSGLRMAPLLEGARGKRVNRDALVQALLMLSNIAADHERILELDLNPVIANAEGCHCVDVRIIRTV